MNIRERIEKTEQTVFDPKASFSIASRGRKSKEPKDILRTEYMRDRDRIIHSESFRRLKHKTQVFLAPRQEEFRTRLTHTLEVSQIARTISRSLSLNEDLTEAIALGHDVGHTPFGHAGEDVIRKAAYPDFKHSIQSVRVLESIEKKGKGLNLTFEVLDGIEKHSKTGSTNIMPGSKKESASTLEGEIVRISDIIAYVNHDIDDAVRSGNLKESNLPQSASKVLGSSHSKRIFNMVQDVIENSAGKEHISMSPEVLSATQEMRNFLFDNVYSLPQIETEMEKAKHILFELYHLLMKNIGLAFEFMPILKNVEGEDKRIAVDCIALMTDYEAMRFFYRHYVPKTFFLSEQI
ncbi:MAG: deoxyguanosinetriphosphate triphosphohydrolase [Spirochaetes bacterium GWF1_51_8]|nr:MAG: deoxyguanosinetriphosphate triphosphohydrolase [Spirochaetes bacterium GWF1_51_8]